MRGAILQPGYFPWLGFFNQMALSDVFVFYDDVQYDKRGWRNRNRIKSPSGPVWLTVPVFQKGLFDQNLHHTRIDNTRNWAAKHLKTIEFNYRTAPFYSTYHSEIESILLAGHQSLVDLDLALIHAHNRWLRIDSVETVRSSGLAITGTDKTGRLVSICRHVGITEYISGPLCKNYLDVRKFYEAGISVYLHEYQHPVYRQLHGEFVPYLAALDAVLNEGPATCDWFRQPESLIETCPDPSTD